MSIIDDIRRKRCAVPRSADYSTNQNTQLRLCRGRTAEHRVKILAVMNRYRSQCQPQGAACELQVKRKLSIIDDIRRKRCAIPGSADYSTNQNTQLRLCRGRTAEHRVKVLAVMNRYRSQCQPQGAACELQVKKKISLITRIRQKGCAVPAGADYSTNQGTQFQLCQGRTTQQRAGVLANMDGYLFKCRP